MKQNNGKMQFVEYQVEYVECLACFSSAAFWDTEIKKITEKLIMNWQCIKKMQCNCNCNKLSQAIISFGDLS